DIIANAVYDPNKTYKFVIDGLFDIDGDGITNRYETQDLAALIEQWGGTVEDEVVGDIDFIVLGEKPTLPPPPGPGAPSPPCRNTSAASARSNATTSSSSAPRTPPSRS